MIQILLSRLSYVIIILSLQIFVFNHINLWGYATPLLGVMVLLRTPLNVNRKWHMLFAFATGLVLDAFSNTPGVAAGAMTATAFAQYPLMHSMVTKDVPEDTEPSISLMGKAGYLSYTAILMAVHHIIFFIFEAFNLSNFPDLLLRLLGTYILSFALACGLEMLRSSK